FSYTVTNVGAGATPTTQSSWDDLIYLSKDGLLDSQADRYLAAETHTGGLAGGAAYTITKTVRAPFDLTGGSYVFVVTDPARLPGDSGKVFEGVNERNNSRASPQPLILVRPPPADLIASNVT